MERSLFYGSPSGSFYASVNFNPRMWGLGVSLNSSHPMLTRLMAACGPFWLTVGEIHQPQAHQTAHHDLDSVRLMERKVS